MNPQPFVDRVFARLNPNPSDFKFEHWNHSGRPTDEGFGIQPVADVDPEKLVAAVLDVDHYVGNIDHVTECRMIADDRYDGTTQKRFYQKLTIPMLGSVHHELVLADLGERDGFRVVACDVLRSETDALSAKAGFRSDYNSGAWLVKPGVVGYALSSAPKRDDVGFLKWQALTKGANAAASTVVKGAVSGMVTFSKSRG
ncbi:MAG: hypothetical protein AAGA48_41095 [Myxococcota bacterium]